MTDMSIQKFVDALALARRALAEVDETEVNALLARWYEHRRRYVKPYDSVGGSVLSVPPFRPEWHDLTLEDTDGYELHFEKWQCGEMDYVVVPTAFLLDPDGWIAQDRKERVTKETWDHQRERAAQAHIQARLEKQAEALRKAGFKVEKE